ncbi:hypothetical protein HK102_003508, partial [Quaeritorhiza haematococci]
LWVKFNTKLTKVETKDCGDVDDLRSEAHRKLGLDRVPADYTLHTNENEDALELDDPLSDIPDLDKNDEDHPLIVKVAESAPAPTGESRLEVLRRGLMCG